MDKIKFDNPRAKNRYQIIKMVGEGSYGVVYKAKVVGTNNFVAIKEIVHNESLGRMLFLLRELRIMNRLKHHNLITLHHILFSQTISFYRVFFVFDFLPTDLCQVIRCEQIVLEDEHVKKIMFDLFSVVDYLHSNNIAHRDIKPNNILINEECEVRLCDLGLAKQLDDNFANNTDYIMARNYRAPEVIYSPKMYTFKVDVWSLGCIFYELMRRNQLFKAKNHLHHLELILECIGFPDNTALQQIKQEEVKRYIMEFANRNFVNKIQNVMYSNPLAVDLLVKCLIFNPDQRISTKDALKHEYFASINNQANGMEIEKAIPTDDADFDFNNKKLTVLETKLLIIEEINLINAEANEDLIDISLYRYYMGIEK